MVSSRCVAGIGLNETNGGFISVTASTGSRLSRINTRSCEGLYKKKKRRENLRGIHVCIT